MAALRTLRPPPGPPVLIAGERRRDPAAVRMSPGSARRGSCGSGTGDGEGARPPAPVTAGGPAPGPGVRASPPRGRGGRWAVASLRAQCRTHPPGARTPALPGSGGARARAGGLLRTAAAAVQAAAATAGRREREGRRITAGGRGCPAFAAAAWEAPAAPASPGGGQGRRLRAWGAWSGRRALQTSGTPRCGVWEK